MHPHRITHLFRAFQTDRRTARQCMQLLHKRPTTCCEPQNMSLASPPFFFFRFLVCSFLFHFHLHFLLFFFFISFSFFFFSFFLFFYFRGGPACDAMQNAKLTA